MMGLQATSNKRKYEMSACGDVNDSQTNCKNARYALTQTTNNTNSSIICSNNSLVNGPASPTSPPSMLLSDEDSIAKLEAVAVPGESSWNCEPIVDSISKLQAVAVPGETWGSDSTRSTLATTLLATDDLDDDDDDFEDDFEDDETILPNYSPIRYPCSPNRGYIPAYPKPGYFPEPYQHQNCSRTPNGPQQYSNRGYGWSQHGYYSPPYEAASPQQTIRCAENGKSYFELGSANYNNMNNFSAQTRHIKRCCDGRNMSCNNKQCYKERRLKMMNLSMFKLARFRQASDQSLYRSVLICNTLKSIEKEIETENKEFNHHHHQQQQQHQQHHQQMNQYHPHHHSHHQNNQNQNQQQHLHHQQQNSSPPGDYNGPHFNNNNNNNNNNRLMNSEKLLKTDLQNKFSDISNNNSSSYNNNNNNISRVTQASQFNETITNQLSSYDHHPLKDPQSGRATPFPMATTTYHETDSGFGDEDCNRSINWGSVLSLSSQSALDPLNNNDLLLNDSSSETNATTPSCLTSNTENSTCSDSENTTINSNNNNSNNINSNSSNNNNSTTTATTTSSTSLTSLTTFSSSNCDLSLTTLTTSPSSLITSCASSIQHTNWDFAYLDMDLGYDMFPNCYKLTSFNPDDMLLKSPIMEPSKVVCDSDMDTFTTHIMVGS